MGTRTDYSLCVKNPIVSIGHFCLQNQAVYDLYQTVVGGVAYRRKLVSELAQLNKPSFIDLGCGTATIARELDSNIKYIGVDNSENYLMKAKREFPQHKFLNQNLGETDWGKYLSGQGPVVASGLGLLHHLDDDSAKSFLGSCREILDKESLLFTVDPVVVKDTTRIARWFANNDRGKYIRGPEKIQELFKYAGFEIEIKIKKMQFMIPLDTIEVTAKSI